MDADPRATDSEIDLRLVYEPADLEGFDAERELGDPGRPPFTRGIHASMYRTRLWTMRRAT